MLNFFRKLFGRAEGQKPASRVVVASTDPSGLPPFTFVGEPESDAPVVLVRELGTTMIMDRLAYEYRHGLARGGDPSQAELDAHVSELQLQMKAAAANLDFERAAVIRDDIKRLRNADLGLPWPGRRA